MPVDIGPGKLYNIIGSQPTSPNSTTKEEQTMNGKRIFQLCLVLILLLATFATTSNASAQSSCGSTYVIRRGDWMAKIARRCGVTLSQLYAANPWVGYYIYPGDVLVIPGGYYDGTGGPFCGPSYDYYGAYWVVCPGDTLGGIAMYYGTTWRYLQWYNGIPNANRIFPGQIIRP
jgi:LysM repeat protein